MSDTSRPRAHRSLLTRAAAMVGILIVAVAVALAVWPLHANGVSGTALTPHYATYFGFTTYHSLPPNPTLTDLRRAGVRVPSDVVDHRRHLAELVGAVGLVVLAGAGTLTLRRRSTGRA